MYIYVLYDDLDSHYASVLSRGMCLLCDIYYFTCSYFWQALCAGLVQWERSHGSRNSALLFIHWLLQTVANTLIFQSQLRQRDTVTTNH